MAELTDSAENFFEPSSSPFQYSDTIAQLYFPNAASGATKTEQHLTPDNHCRTCGKAYLVTNQEISALKKLGVAHCGECFYCRITRLAKPYSHLR